MTAVLIAWVASAPVIAVVIGHRLAGRSFVATVRKVTDSPRVRLVAFWVVATVAGLALAFATRGQVVTWHGVVEVPA